MGPLHALSGAERVWWRNADRDHLVLVRSPKGVQVPQERYETTPGLLLEPRNADPVSLLWAKWVADLSQNGYGAEPEEEAGPTFRSSMLTSCTGEALLRAFNGLTTGVNQKWARGLALRRK